MKKFLIILLSLLIVAGGVWGGGLYYSELQQVQHLEERFREGSYDYIYIPGPDRMTFKSLYDRIEDAINSNASERFYANEHENLSNFLEALEDEEYFSERVKETLNTAFLTLGSFEEKAEFLTCLRYSDYYTQDMVITANEMREYIQKYGENHVGYSQDSEGFYSSEGNKRSSGKSYIGKYGTYTDYGNSYYGDFCIEQATNVGTVAGDYDLTTKITYDNRLYFRDYCLSGREQVPAEGSCIYSGEYLFVDEGTEWQGYLLAEKHMAIDHFRITK